MSTPDSPGASDVRERWKAALAAGRECLSIERLAESALDAREQSHVEACVRCQTERALALEFEASEPLPDEGAAVQWIARETKRRVFPEAAPPSQRARGWFRLPAWATSLAAAAAVILGVTLLLREPGSIPGRVDPQPTYRAASVELTAPIGDVTAVPAAFAWSAVSGAARYELKVAEVDGTELWRTTTPTTSVTVPDVVRAAAKPARTLTWTVIALDPSGKSVAQPGTATFRVMP